MSHTANNYTDTLITQFEAKFPFLAELYTSAHLTQMIVKKIMADLNITPDNQHCMDIVNAFKVGSNEYDLNTRINSEKLTLEAFVEANLAFSLYCELKYLSIDSDHDWKLCAGSLKQAYTNPDFEAVRILGSRYNESTRASPTGGKAFIAQLSYYLVAESDVG